MSTLDVSIQMSFLCCKKLELLLEVSAEIVIGSCTEGCRSSHGMMPSIVFGIMSSIPKVIIHPLRRSVLCNHSTWGYDQ